MKTGKVLYSHVCYTCTYPCVCTKHRAYACVTCSLHRIYLFNCEGCDCLNLSGPEGMSVHVQLHIFYLNSTSLLYACDVHVGNVSREHVFYLTFPKEVVTDDIKNLFSPFGKFMMYTKV